MNDFTSWEESLEHHGIPGMKWGVRRYQNSDGSLTKAGQARYGEHGVGSSARRMSRDWNNLDRGFANVAAERASAQNRANKYAMKAARYSKKKGLKTAKEMSQNKKMNKYADKALAASKKAKLSNDQMKAIENLQWRILEKANRKGYTTKSKAVTRIGHTQKERTLARLGALSGIGGAVGGTLNGMLMASTGTKVQGQKVKISKKGSGSTSIVDYSGVNRAERRARRKALKGR